MKRLGQPLFLWGRTCVCPGHSLEEAGTTAASRNLRHCLAKDCGRETTLRSEVKTPCWRLLLLHGQARPCLLLGQPPRAHPWREAEAGCPPRGPAHLTTPATDTHYLRACHVWVQVHHEAAGAPACGCCFEEGGHSHPQCLSLGRSYPWSGVPEAWG